MKNNNNNNNNNNNYNWVIWLFTAVVYAIVIGLHELPEIENAPAFVYKLPLVHAIINGTCFVLLISSLIAVKNKNIGLHKKINTVAMILSVVFLLSYVTSNVFKGDTAYLGAYKNLYYFILISHILLAGLSLPAILFAYLRGVQGEIEKHRKIVRYTYPVWLYVTLTGVFVYLFLAPYY